MGETWSIIYQGLPRTLFSSRSDEVEVYILPYIRYQINARLVSCPAPPPRPVGKIEGRRVWKIALLLSLSTCISEGMLAELINC